MGPRADADVLHCSIWENKAELKTQLHMLDVVLHSLPCLFVNDIRLS